MQPINFGRLINLALSYSLIILFIPLSNRLAIWQTALWGRRKVQTYKVRLNLKLQDIRDCIYVKKKNDSEPKDLGPKITSPWALCFWNICYLIFSLLKVFDIFVSSKLQIMNTDSQQLSDNFQKTRQ